MADDLEVCSVVVQSPSFSCCGIVLDSDAGIIITVGSIASGFWRQDNNNLTENAGLSRNHVFSCDTNVQARPPEQDLHVEVIVKKTPHSQASSNDFLTLNGRIIALWRDEKLSDIYQKMFPIMEWTFEEDTNNRKFVDKVNKDCYQDSRKAYFGLADFALIEVNELHASLSSKSSLKLKENVKTGDPLTVVGTPFGSECWSVFFNSVSKGIVSNVIGSNSEIILTDARCVPGCEGCPVFLDSSPGRVYGVYGIVVAPFCWRSGEWIGLTLVCSISHILKNLLETNLLTKMKSLCHSLEHVLQMDGKCSTENPDNSLCLHNNKSYNQEIFQGNYSKEQDRPICDVLGKSKPCVVLIQCGTTWGSGIITDIEDGLVITCRHILTEGGRLESKRISTNTCTSSSTSINSNKRAVPLIIHDVLSHTVYDDVEIIFATAQDCALDFALLRVQKHDFKIAIKVRNSSEDHNGLNNQSHNAFRKGEEVLAIGHSLFGSQLSNGPCISSGIISNITYMYAEGIPAMLQSTAVVHCGGSGGAIVSRSTGELLGMVTSNIKDANSSSSYPHINFSIPANLIVRLIALSMSDIKTRDVYLKDLASGIDNAWHLNSTRNSKSKL